MSEIKISVSILSADFAHLQDQIDLVSNADYIHIDVMDGHFAPNLTMGPDIIKDIKSDMVRDVHLMVTNPEDFIEPFVKAGAGIITVHAEAVKDLGPMLDKIHATGVKAGVSLNPDTNLDPIVPHLDKIDHVLIMTVNPGFSGQKFIDVTDKIRALRVQYKGDIAVDGGINDETGAKVAAAGANILVAASFIYKSSDPRKAVDVLRQAGEKSTSPTCR